MLLHNVCIIYTYINVCTHMHPHCKPWHHYAYGLVTSHHTWILGNSIVRVSNLADLWKLCSTLKWWEDTIFCVICPVFFFCTRKLSVFASHFLASKEEYYQGFCVCCWGAACVSPVRLHQHRVGNIHEGRTPSTWPYTHIPSTQLLPDPRHCIGHEEAVCVWEAIPECTTHSAEQFQWWGTPHEADGLHVSEHVSNH